MDKIVGILNLKEYNGLSRSGEGSKNLREFQKNDLWKNVFEEEIVNQIEIKWKK
jgi:hypothetical protein